MDKKINNWEKKYKSKEPLNFVYINKNFKNRVTTIVNKEDRYIKEFLFKIPNANVKISNNKNSFSKINSKRSLPLKLNAKNFFIVFSLKK